MDVMCSLRILMQLINGSLILSNHKKYYEFISILYTLRTRLALYCILISALWKLY